MKKYLLFIFVSMIVLFEYVNYFKHDNKLCAILLMLSVATSAFVIYLITSKQKKYYDNILNSSTNIIIINKNRTIISVNKVFFKYFSKYKTIEEFRKEHSCICDLFGDNDGYITKYMNGVYWIDYIIKNSSKINKVKINIDKKEYYFSISITLVSQEKSYYSIVFMDITSQELHQQELEYLSVTDSLTKIKNRYYFNEQIKVEVSSSKRYKYPLSLVMFDIDYFKKVNDEYGHDVGDKVLVEYSKFISSFLRDSDEFCRVGGEEFMIILPHIIKEDAYKIAEKLRIEIEMYKKIVPITMSFGVTQYIEDESIKSLYKRVDVALYKAKDTGRNRVVVA